MIRHAVWIRFSAQADAAERNAILGSLIALCDQVGDVTSFACGPDADGHATAAGFGHAFVVAFETEAARATYRALPGYAAVMARLIGAAEGGPDGVRTTDSAAG